MGRRNNADAVEARRAELGDDDDDGGGGDRGESGVDADGARARTEELSLDGDGAAGPRRRRARCCACWRRCWNPDAPGLRGELVRIFRLALPVMAGFLSQNLTLQVNLLLVGHLGRVELAASAMAWMMANITGSAFGFGLCSAIDTLASQAYGAGNYRRVGHILQRALIIETIVCVPVLAIWLNAEAILLGLGQEPQIALLAGQYLKYLSIGLWPMFMFEAARRYAQVQGIVWPVFLVNFIGGVAAAGLTYCLINYSHLGVVSAAISTAVAYWFSLLTFILLIRSRGLHRRTWTKFSRDSVRGWREFLRFGVPGMLMVCLEWWSFELSSFLAGLLGEIELGAQSVVLSSLGFLYMFPMSISIAASTLIGNALGANKPAEAKRTAKVLGVVMFILQTVLCVTAVSLRQWWGLIFTSDVEVVARVAQVALLFGPMILFDGSQAMLSGVLRGCGRVKIGAALNFVGYYVIGAPIGACLAFLTNLGVMGIWSGLVTASSTTSIAYLIALRMFNWNKIAADAVNAARTQHTVAASAALGDGKTGTVEMASLVRSDALDEANAEALPPPPPPTTSADDDDTSGAHHSSGDDDSDGHGGLLHRGTDVHDDEP